MDIMQIVEQYSIAAVACAGCIALFREMQSERKAHKEQLDRINAEHHEEVKELSTVVRNNTIVLEKLSEVIRNAENCD